MNELHVVQDDDVDPFIAEYHAALLPKFVPLVNELESPRTQFTHEDIERQLALLDDVLSILDQFAFQRHEVDYGFQVFINLAEIHSECFRKQHVEVWRRLLHWISDRPATQWQQPNAMWLAVVLLDPFSLDPIGDVDREWFLECLSEPKTRWITYEAFSEREDFPECLGLERSELDRFPLTIQPEA